MFVLTNFYFFDAFHLADTKATKAKVIKSLRDLTEEENTIFTEKLRECYGTKSIADIVDELCKDHGLLFTERQVRNKAGVLGLTAKRGSYAPTSLAPLSMKDRKQAARATALAEKEAKSNDKPFSIQDHRPKGVTKSTWGRFFQ